MPLAPQPEPGRPDPARTKVLLVDDSPTQLLYYRTLLERGGFAVRTAGNGAEALLSFGEDRPALIVSDCDMPLLDGFQLCRLLKDDPGACGVPLLLLTGSLTNLSRFWGRTCGADQFLLKGGSGEDFLAAVRDLARAAGGPAGDEEAEAGPDRPGPDRRQPLRAEDLSRELALALEHRLLETTARNAVAALAPWLDDPPRLAWAFLALFEDLVAPGAVYLLLPGAGGHVCRLLAGAGLDPDRERRFLEPLAALPYLDGAPPVERRTIAWQPDGRPELVARHFPLAAATSGARAQWGVLVPRAVHQSHRNLFREASAELEKLFHLMAALDLLATANRRLTEADEAKNAFILTLSHDLRSPLGALQLGLDAMELDHDQLPETVRHWIEVGRRSVERLIRLVNGILDLGKMEAGTFSFEPVRADAAALALEAVRSLESLAAARQVRLARVPGDAEGFWIRVDPDRFLQILVNLLANAIKFSPSPGEVRVDLERDGPAVAVSVRDQGPGIPEAFRDRIFGKFQQAERKASGTGLGLAIARQLTEAMGGAIGFESAEGRGTCFTVRFPGD